LTEGSNIGFLTRQDLALILPALSARCQQPADRGAAPGLWARAREGFRIANMSATSGFRALERGATTERKRAEFDTNAIGAKADAAAEAMKQVAGAGA